MHRSRDHSQRRLTPPALARQVPQLLAPHRHQQHPLLPLNHCHLPNLVPLFHWNHQLRHLHQKLIVAFLPQTLILREPHYLSHHLYHWPLI